MKMSRSVLMACLLAVAMTIAVMPVVFPALGAGPKGTVIKFTVPKQLNMLYDGTYNCWIPDSVGTIRCIIVHQHGCTREGDAQMMMNDVQWLTFAKKWHAAFIAPALITGAPGTGSTQCSNWCTMSNGSGNSFLMALDTLARRAGHPEIKTVPWAIWGHSGGSLWMTAMATTYPERIAVGIAQSGSVEMSNTPGALKIPILHHNGRKDMIYNDVQFNNGRAKGALWAHAINPHPLWVTGSCAPPNKLCWDTTVYGHAPWDLRMICIPWMDIALTARLPDKAGDSLLKPMDTSNAWIGDWTTHAITTAATYTGNRGTACWFPNERWAKMWQEYMATGTQKDSTPPPAPYNLTGTYANRQIVLKWDADADLETGIKTFIIYRNNAIVQTLQYNTTTLFTTEKGFQRWDDGDQPNPSPAPTMTYTNTGLTDTGTYVYQVSTVNWSDVAGPKSTAIALSHGQVTGTIASRNKTAASFAQVSRCWNLDNGRLDLRPGVVDIYDIRGRLLKTLAVKDGGRMDVKTLLGASAEKMVMVRNRAK